MGDSPIEFFVNGLPAPQGSHKAVLDRHSGRAIVVDGGTAATKRAHRLWRQAVQEAAEKVMRDGELETLDEPVAARIMFLVPMVAGDPYRLRHAVTPDIDKLIRAVFDSLTKSGMVRDDSRFFSVFAETFYAAPDEATGARVRLTPFGELEFEDQKRIKDERIGQTSLL